MREKAQQFNNEVNKIFEDNNININYITLKDKNADWKFLSKKKIH